MVEAAAQEAEGNKRRRHAVPGAATGAAVLLLLVLGLTGCGGSDESPREPKAPGPQGAKTVKEVKRPDGEPKGVMLIFSGGAWLAPPPTEVETTRHYGKRYTELGWVAVNVGYRPGGEESFADVTSAYDKAKADHPGLPICAVGESSGGHLALMLAITRELDCVQSVGAPADLTRGLPAILERTATSVFGAGDLQRWSPALRADEIGGEVMIVHASNDKVVPVAQARALAAALSDEELIVLRRGDLAWMHGSRIEREAYARYLSREREWLGSLRSR